MRLHPFSWGASSPPNPRVSRPESALHKATAAANPGRQRGVPCLAAPPSGTPPSRPHPPALASRLGRIRNHSTRKTLPHRRDPPGTEYSGSNHQGLPNRSAELQSGRHGRALHSLLPISIPNLTNRSVCSAPPLQYRLEWLFGRCLRSSGSPKYQTKRNFRPPAAWNTVSPTAFLADRVLPSDLLRGVSPRAVKGYPQASALRCAPFVQLGRLPSP